MGLGGFFDRVVNPTNSLGQLGQAILAASGGPIGGAFQSLLQQRQFGQEHALTQQLQQAQLAHMQRQDTQPLIEHAGEDVVTLDPKDYHEISRIHGTPAPDEFDRIAIAAGHPPGTPEYLAAAQGRLAGLSDPPQAVQGFDAQGRPTVTFYHRSDAMPGGPPPAPTPALPAAPSPGVTRETLQQQAAAAIAAGRDPVQVNRRLQTMLQQLEGGASPSSGSGGFPRQDSGAFDFRQHP